MTFLVVKGWGKPGCRAAPEKRRFSDDAGRWGAIHGCALGRRGGDTAAGSVHNDID
jgi:hypothetical protein